MKALHAVRLTLTLGLGGVLAGCATTDQVNLSAGGRPGFALAPENKLAVYVMPDAPAVDRSLAAIVQEELRIRGYELVPLAQSDYIVWVSSLQRRVNPALGPSGDGAIEGTYGGLEFTQRDFATRISLSYEKTGVQAIWIDLFSTQEVKEGTWAVVWGGHVAGKQQPISENPAHYVRRLLSHVEGEKRDESTP